MWSLENLTSVWDFLNLLLAFAKGEELESIGNVIFYSRLSMVIMLVPMMDSFRVELIVGIGNRNIAERVQRIRFLCSRRCWERDVSCFEATMIHDWDVARR